MSTAFQSRSWSSTLNDYPYRVMLDIDILNPVYLVRSFYLVCIIAILTARLLSPLRQRFLAYGARTQHTTHETAERVERLKINPDSSKVLDNIASIHVPHSWFTHFYIVSVASSCLWMWSLSSSSNAPLVDRHDSTPYPRQSNQSAFVCVTLMLIQGIRRFLECTNVFQPSNSRMWIGHYAFGLAFYLFTNTAVWVESMNSTSVEETAFSSESSLLLSPRTYLGLASFAVASAVQFQAHSYLANLRKYTLPTQGLFSYLIAPHYTAECVIYLSLAILGAPEQQTCNRTLLCATLLAAVNLGITAEGTKKWMLDKFRDQHHDIKSRWLLVPGVW